MAAKNPPRDGTAFTAEVEEEARKNAAKKAEAVTTTPKTKPASAEVKTDAPEEKELDGYEPHADNDGNFHLKKMDDGTNVEEGQLMENLTRVPAHQAHELAIEEDAPGFEQSAALMLPRGNPHYDEGGSIAEVKAGESFGEA
jgi:hypothetical protein